MSDPTLKVIAVLLALILAVLLNGADAVKQNLSATAFVVAGIGAVGLAIWLLHYTITSVFEAIREDQRLTKAEGAAWRWKYLLYPSIAWLAGIGFWAFIAAGLTIKHPHYTNALDSIPYKSAPLFLLIAAYIFLFFESARTWLPNLPGTIEAVFRAWGQMFAAPFRVPASRWQEIKAQRLAGVKIGSFRAASSIAMSFLGGCFAFLIGSVILLGVLGNLLWIFTPKL